MSCMCQVSCRVFESKFEIMSVIMVMKELGHFLFFQNSFATLKDDSHLFRVSEEQCVELTFDGLA